MSKDEKNEEDPLILITPQVAIQRIVRGIQGRNNRGIRSLQREVDRTPSLQSGLFQYRDLNILSREASQEDSTLDNLSSLNSIQTNLAIDTFSGGNVDTMP